MELNACAELAWLIKDVMIVDNKRLNVSEIGLKVLTYCLSCVAAFMLCYTQDDANSEGINIHNIYPIEILVGKTPILILKSKRARLVIGLHSPKSRS